MANVLTDRAAQRVKSATQWVEGNRSTLRESVSSRNSGEVVTVRVTSSTADGNGNHPGVVTAYHGDGWYDYDAVKARPANGETLLSGRRYTARNSGYTVDEDPVYVVDGYVDGSGANPALAYWVDADTLASSVAKDAGHLLYNATLASGDGAGVYNLADVMVGGSVEFPGDSALPGYYLYTAADTDVYGFSFAAGAHVYGQLLAVTNSKTSTNAMTLKHGSGFSPAATDLHNGVPGALNSAYDVVLGPAQAVLYVWWGSWILVGSSAPVPSAVPTEIDGGTW